MKKCLAVCLIVFMLFVTGCTDNNNSSKVSKTTDTSSNATTVSGDNGITTTAAVTTTIGSGPAAADNSNNDNGEEVTSSGRKIKIQPITSAVAKWSPALAESEKTIGDTMESNITNSKYELKWIDDFSGTSYNSSYWRFQPNCANDSEVHVNRPENIEVKDGNINFYGKKSSTLMNGQKNNGTAKTSYYSGATINSSGKVSYKYGRFEARIKAPFGAGMWPAFWTCGTVRGWPWGGEIDIFEFYGGDTTDNMFNRGLHWCSPEVAAAEAYTDYPTGGHRSTYSNFTMPKGTAGTKLADSYHVYGMEWTDKKIYFYFDGVLEDSQPITDSTMKVAFHNAHYMLLNLSMYKNNPPNPPDNNKVWPQVMKVDWVKIWQIKK